MKAEDLKNRQYSLLIDSSTSMSRPVSSTNKKTRWSAMQEVAYGLALKMQELDPDGITVVPFASSFERHDNVTPDKVDELFRKEPNGSTALHLALKSQLDDFFKRFTAGQVPNGETIVVATDGEADDPQAVVQLIIDASNRINRDEDLAILFAQIGDDEKATAFLKFLDDELEGKGAKFDIVDTKTFTQIGNTPLVQVLMDAQTD